MMSQSFFADLELRNGLIVGIVAKDRMCLHADSEVSDQTGRMPRLICVFAGRTVILLVLSCRGSNIIVID